ncbi:12393_t:CDS:1, partial [Gigaspora margarita]
FLGAHEQIDLSVHSESPIRNIKLFYENYGYIGKKDGKEVKINNEFIKCRNGWINF